MEKSTISELKNRLSAYLKKVRAGQAILILNRDQPVARLERVESQEHPDERLERLEEALRLPEATSALERLRTLAGGVLPSDAVRSTAQRLLRVHPLRAADSLQLAAAVLVSEYEPATLDLVSLDDQLNLAASREGFRVLPFDLAQGTLSGSRRVPT